jgi:hypothetical protein
MFQRLKYSDVTQILYHHFEGFRTQGLIKICEHFLPISTEIHSFLCAGAAQTNEFSVCASVVVQHDISWPNTRRRYSLSQPSTSGKSEDTKVFVTSGMMFIKTFVTIREHVQILLGVTAKCHNVNKSVPFLMKQQFRKRKLGTRKENGDL